MLLNGRRVTGYGFAQNLQETFVDLNAIPASAVDRIEVLKDGASAIYGSDAIAGVVNIILRRDFKGIEAAGDVGFFEGAQDYRANVIAGFGDLGSDRFNVFGMLDYYKRDEILLSDTKFGETRDYRHEDGGGRNFQSLTAGGTWQNVTGLTAAGTPIVGNLRRAISQCGAIGGRARWLRRGFFTRLDSGRSVESAARRSWRHANQPTRQQLVLDRHQQPVVSVFPARNASDS